KIKRPQSNGIQDEGRLIDFYFLYCLLDGGLFTGPPFLLLIQRFVENRQVTLQLADNFFAFCFDN
ncbi:hypothetical protein FHS18_006560, partial [Paenibacillus phyllosphaerae]|nr:hypothetical protein [Paenibacillus phyllosphaerae]